MEDVSADRIDCSHVQEEHEPKIERPNEEGVFFFFCTRKNLGGPGCHLCIMILI